MLRVFLGDRRKAFGQEHPGGGKEIPCLRSIIGLQKEKARFRRFIPDTYALSAGKDANRSPQ
jgi:hypothetical protein